MVAETAQQPAPARTHKRKGGRPEGADELPILTRLKARNLFLIQGASHEVIARETGLTRRQSQSLATREGWAKLRRARKQRLIANQDARASGQVTEAMEAMASVSEQHAMQALLNNVPDALARDDKEAARDFQAFTGGVRNLVQTAKMCRETSDGAANQAGAGLSVFIVRVGQQAQPADADRIENAKQVIEVSATAIESAPTSCAETDTKPAE